MVYLNQVVLVSGAGGIGKSISLAFGQRGAKVAFFDKDPNQLKEATDLLNSQKITHLAEKIDVTDLGSMDAFLDDVKDKLGPVSILINNVGMGKVLKFPDTKPADLEQVWKTNFAGPFFLTQKIVKDMREGGNIIFITSIHAQQPSLDPSYDSSKAAVNSLVLNLSLDLAKRGIRVNAIAPGHIDINPSLSSGTVSLRDIGTQDIPREQKDVPLFKKAGLPEDIAKACLFLADNEQARYITGVILPVTGGLHIPKAAE